MRLGRLSALVAAVASVAALASCGGTHQEATTSAGQVPAVLVRVDGARAGRSVPRSFLGLSIEWDSVGSYAGPLGRRGTGLRALLAPLVRETGGLALRIGGDTADQAWWNPGARRRPAGILQDITPATLASVAWLAGSTRGPVTLNVNLALGDPRNARALALATQRRLAPGSLETVEVGNEPDLYTRARVFHVPGHVHVRLRKRARYDPGDYRRDVKPYLGVLSAPPRPAARLAVAGFAGPGWWSSLPGLLASAGGQVGALSGHLYALPRCGGRAPPASWMLTTKASRGRAASLAPLVALGRRYGLPVRVTELNSAACGGRPGLSDTFVSALWLTDTLFALLREGVDQADVHTWTHARYASFDVAGTRARARPSLDAMLAFARAAPPGSRLIAVGGKLGALRAWATSDARGTARIALIAPSAVRAEVAVGGTGCGEAWVATAQRRSTTRVCARRGRIAIALAARSLAVLTLPAGQPPG